MDYLSRIAVVEDDPEISRMMTAYMTDHGFEVTAARSGRDLDRVMSSGNKIDCVILDVGLPGEDGLSICRRLRGKSTVPIIMVTGRGTDTDRIVGLELGADDYLPKPFNPRELLARVRAVMRRSVAQEPAPETPRILAFEGWRLDMSRRQLFGPDGAPRSLTSGEFNILSIFCQNPRKVLSRDDLLDLLHGRAAAVFDRSIDVQISRLRRKIETNLKDPSFIKTVRYGGYFFTPLVSPLADG
ncbi:MAG TPA: response regulator [Rhodopila sp.]|jgi:two-component system OmpR family response regulator|nr:response regulator [Rhodopila sp.]